MGKKVRGMAAASTHHVGAQDSGGGVLSLIGRKLLGPLQSLAGSSPVEAEIGCRRFLDRFEAEYGNVHPQLLDCNFHQACQGAKTEVKLLVVYLHCQYHINTPSFCRTIFSSQSFVEFLDSNMLVWVGDVASTDGLTAANHLQASSYPYLGVVAPVESGLMTIGKLEGTFTEDQARVVMVSLLESFSALAAVQLAEREAASAE